MVICKDIQQSRELEELQRKFTILDQQLQETKAELKATTADLKATTAELKASKDLQRKAIIAVSVQSLLGKMGPAEFYCDFCN